jgi:hypothetical protein
LDGYYPQPGEIGKQVTEAFDVMIKGSSDANLEALVRAIELALDFAKKHPSGPDGVWVLFTANYGILTSWQSRITGGTLLHNLNLSKRWRDLKVKAQVIIERAPFWESEDPVVLELTNRGGTDGADADIVNHQDAGATDDLYVEIAADQVTGVLPTPAIIEYKNTVNDEVLVDHLSIGQFAASGNNEPPEAASLILEGSGTADTDCSGGEYDTETWEDDAENQLDTWTLASGDFRQRNYKVIVRLRDVTEYTDLWLKLKLLAGTTVLTETRWCLVAAGEALVMIGTLQIPPFRFGTHIDLGDLTIGLYEKRAAGAGTLTLDFIGLIPQDSWRKIGAIIGLAYDETLVDNPVEETLVTQYGESSYKVTHKVDEGDPIMLQPGVKNVLYFLHDTTTGTAPIARTANVVVKCHPRRLTV